MDFFSLKNTIDKAAKAILDNEKFLVVSLATDARKLAQEYPHDQTCVGMSNFLTKRANKSEPFITRSELNQAYQHYQISNNRFKEVFAEELGINDAPKITTLQRDPNEGKDLFAETLKNVDLEITEGLKAAFDDKYEIKTFAPNVGVKAAQACLQELNRHVAPYKIDVVAGQKDLIICRAAFNTPKGETAILVPVEVKNDKTLLPTLFLSVAGVAELNKANLTEHLKAMAGKNLPVHPNEFLKVVSAAKNGLKPVSLDMMVVKTSLSGMPTKNVPESTVDYQIPKMAATDEFAKKLASPLGAAEVIFGKKAVDNARSMVKVALENFGYRNPNIKVADADAQAVYLAVSVDHQAGFKVPVKMVNKVPQAPVMALASGKMYDLTAQGLSQLLASQEIDGAMMAVASPAYELKSSDLVDVVEKALVEGNLVKAEDALTVLQNRNDPAYKSAFQMYLNGLEKTASAQPTVQCSMMRKVSHSKYLICGHTNLPIHKVYQDADGHCLPLYRKGIAEPGTAFTLANKVFWGK